MITVKRRELKERMIKAGLTGAGLAKKAGITQGYVCLILNGKRTVLPPTAKKICDVLFCNFDDVFFIGWEASDNVTDRNTNSK